MKISVKTIPNAKQNSLEKLSDGSYKVRIAAPAVDGKANSVLLDFLAGKFGCRKSEISILQGEKRRIKLINIPG